MVLITKPLNSTECTNHIAVGSQHCAESATDDISLQATVVSLAALFLYLLSLLSMHECTIIGAGTRDYSYCYCTFSSSRPKYCVSCQTIILL